MGGNDRDIIVTYELNLEKGDDPEKIARGIALEQTVELDLALVKDEGIRDHIIGDVFELVQLADHRFSTKIAYDSRTVGGEIPQFLNLLYGNISLKRGMVVTDFQVTSDMFKGPRHGIEGIRTACGQFELPLLATALKPLGSDSKTLAKMAYDLALGGLDIIKDDHGVANQPFSVFETRVARVSEAVSRANRETGRNCLYFPNFLPRFENVENFIRVCRDHQVPGLLVCPFLLGMDIVRYLRENTEFMLMLHPSLTGGLFSRHDHGIRPGLVLGKLFRFLGGDASIFPNVGGRFALDQNACSEICNGLREHHPRLKPAFPMPAGGITMDGIPLLRQIYGNDQAFLMGGALFRADTSLVNAARKFREAVLKLAA